MIASSHPADVYFGALQLFCALGVPLMFVVFGLTLGVYFERKHLRSIDQRKADLHGVQLTDTRHSLIDADPTVQATLLTGEAVYAAGYLKGLLAGIKKIFGGELRSYHSLLMRTRDEAILRVVEQAAAMGYDAVCNLRIDSSDIANATNRKKNPGTYVCIIVSGTAFRRKR